jgi:hypothetical protein
VLVRLELLLQRAEIRPGLEVVVAVGAVLEGDDLGGLLGEQSTIRITA